MYSESPPPKSWKLIVFGSTASVLFAASWLRELNVEEAIIALVALQFTITQEYLTPMLLGAPADVYPLPSWILALVCNLLPLTELSVRAVGIFALMFLATICGLISYRSAGPRAAMVSTAAALTNIAAVIYAVNDLRNILFCVMVNLSWLCWYEFGRIRKKWLYAWFFAHLFVVLALLTDGFRAIVFFYLPLLFQRRPLKIWLRLRQGDHWLSFGAMAVIILLWTTLVPHQAERMVAGFEGFRQHTPPSSYVLNFILYPIRAPLLFFPWLLFVWPAYCAAFRSIEKDPVFAQFLRTITYTLFIAIWFVPTGAPDELLLPLIGPLSILVGLNYDILIRRHGFRLEALTRLLSSGTIGLALVALILLAGILFHNGRLALQYSPLIVLMTSSLAMAIIVIRNQLHVPVSISVLLAINSAYAIAAGAQAMYTDVYQNPAQQLAAELSKRLPSECTVYNMTSKHHALYSVSFYLNHPSVFVSSTRALPRSEDTVFVLTDDETPISKDRIWHPLGDRVHFEDQLLRLWIGQSRRIEVVPSHVEFLASEQSRESGSVIQTVVISHRFQLPIELSINADRAEFVTDVTPNQTIIMPGESVELRIHINTEALPIDSATDVVELEFTNLDHKIVRELPIVLRRAIRVDQ